MWKVILYSKHHMILWNSKLVMYVHITLKISWTTILTKIRAWIMHKTKFASHSKTGGVTWLGSKKPYILFYCGNWAERDAYQFLLILTLIVMNDFFSTVASPMWKKKGSGNAHGKTKREQQRPCENKEPTIQHERRQP